MLPRPNKLVRRACDCYGVGEAAPAAGIERSTCDRPKQRPRSPQQTVEPAVQRPRSLATAQTRRATPVVGSFLAADSGGAKRPGFSLEIGAGER